MCLCIDLCIYVKLQYGRLLLPEACLINPGPVSFQYHELQNLHGLSLKATVSVQRKLVFDLPLLQAVTMHDVHVLT